MEQIDVEKEIAVSWIEIHRSSELKADHGQSQEIHDKLHKLIKVIKIAGYVPDNCFWLHDTEDSRRQELLLYHREVGIYSWRSFHCSRGPT